MTLSTSQDQAQEERVTWLSDGKRRRLSALLGRDESRDALPVLRAFDLSDNECRYETRLAGNAQGPSQEGRKEPL